MRDETTGEFQARASGKTGCEVLDPHGEAIAWTEDGWWAATIVRLLNGADERDLVGVAPDIGAEDASEAENGEDIGATAREAISHLAYHGVALRWDLPGEASKAVRSMVKSYLKDETLSDLACRYVMKRLADDHLGISGIEIPEESPGPGKNRSVRG